MDYIEEDTPQELLDNVSVFMERKHSNGVCVTSDQLWALESSALNLSQEFKKSFPQFDWLGLDSFRRAWIRARKKSRNLKGGETNKFTSNLSKDHKDELTQNIIAVLENSDNLLSMPSSDNWLTHNDTRQMITAVIRHGLSFDVSDDDIFAIWMTKRKSGFDRKTDVPTDVPESDLDVDTRERICREMIRRKGQSLFRKQVVNKDKMCLISKVSINDSLEAAHISPYLGDATNFSDNGLTLRIDLHRLFDRGKIRINQQMCVELSEDLMACDCYSNYSGVLIKPVSERQRELLLKRFAIS